MINEDKLRDRVKSKVKRVTYTDIAEASSVGNDEMSRWINGKDATQNFLEKVKEGLTNF